MLAQAQLDEFREAFAAYDKDGGGSIDSTELKALMASVGQVPTDDELAEMIRIADADGSGSVDFYEFVTLMAHKMADVKSESHLRAAFSIFDFSGDGNIQAEELRRVLMNVGEPVTMDDINQLIQEVDLNQDGELDYEEFAKVIASETPLPPPGEEVRPRPKSASSSSASAARGSDEAPRRKSRARRMLGRGR